MPRLKRVADEPEIEDDVPPDQKGGDDSDAPEAAALARLRDIGARMEAEIAAASVSPPPSGQGAGGAGHPTANTPPPSSPARGQGDAALAREHLRILEAMLFAAAVPLDEASLVLHLKGAHDLKCLLGTLQAEYATRGVHLVKVSGKWAFRTAEDLSWLLEKHAVEEKRLSRAALETLSIIAYHQPVTRAEIEEIRGVTTSKGTLDVLLETGWIRPRGRRRAPGKPLTFGTTPAFLEHFGLDAVGDLPGLAELKAAGLLDGILPPDFRVPSPQNVAALMPDELPLEAGDEEQAQTELELDPPDVDEDGGEGEAEPDDGDESAGRDRSREEAPDAAPPRSPPED